MKKIGSLLLAIVMIVATFAAISIPAAAVDGGWNVYTAKSQYLDGYNGMMHNIAGYEYTEEGLKVASPVEEEPKTTPYVIAQTSNKANLKDGVYMKVRVDEFTYSGDLWFSFHVWDEQNVEPGKQGENYGYGVETLIKTKGATSEDTWDGMLTAMHWYSDIEEGVRIGHGDVFPTDKKADDVSGNDRYAYAPEFDQYVEVEIDGVIVKKPVFILEIKWNNNSLEEFNMPDGMPEMYINGEKAPDAFNLKMADYFKRDDYMAYIGFGVQNSNLGGLGAFTILEYGTSEDSALVPTGDDSREPEMADINYAEIADKSTVSAGEPAIILNGDSDSDNKGKPSAHNGNLISVDDQGFINVKGNSDGYATISMRVKDEVSYSVKDFPISLIVLKNFCTCEAYVNDDGDLELNCLCAEQLRVFALAGIVAADNQNYEFNTLLNEPAVGDKPATKYVGQYTDATTGDSYIYLMANWANLNTRFNTSKEVAELDGRIHGLRIDAYGLKATEENRDNFDICMVGFFASTDEAKEYAMEFISATMDAELPEDTQDNVSGGNETTEEVTTEATEATTEETTEATEAATEAKTEKATEAATEAKTEAAGNDTTEQPSGGCGSTVGFGALAVVALAATGLISFRKKED